MFAPKASAQMEDPRNKYEGHLAPGGTRAGPLRELNFELSIINHEN